MAAPRGMRSVTQVEQVLGRIANPAKFILGKSVLAPSDAKALYLPLHLRRDVHQRAAAAPDMSQVAAPQISDHAASIRAQGKMAVCAAPGKAHGSMRNLGHI